VPAWTAWLAPLAVSMGLPPRARYEGLALHLSGDEARAALWEVIDGAQRTLDVCTFLLGRDALGDAVCERLAARAAAGVEVRLMVDGIGLLMGGRRDLKALAARGVRVARFVPPLRSPLKGRLNLRNHRKMAIADGERLWCGGRNLADEYFGATTLPSAGATGSRAVDQWRDLSFDLRGDTARMAASLFEADWRFATGRGIAPAPLRAPAPAVCPDACAQLVPSGPDYAEDTLHALLVTACFRAQRRILAVTPYLVPDESLMSALVLAARRGVLVDLVLPAASNHRLADLARRRPMRELAEAGARIRLTDGMVHAKAVVFDDVLAVAGSANLDARSLFLNYELMLAFDARGDVLRFARAIEAIAVDARDWAPTPAQPGLPLRLAEGLVLWLAFQL
jgi:cardiolipin synthase